MSTEDLHRPMYVPDLIVNALNQAPDRPLLQLSDGPMLSVGEVRDATSRFVQALQSVGVARGSRVATLSSNRPEVLHVANLRPVPNGEPGEICVRGPLVMDGYLGNPELTFETLKGDWLHTGDVAVRDPDGFLR